MKLQFDTRKGWGVGCVGVGLDTTHKSTVPQHVALRTN